MHIDVSGIHVLRKESKTIRYVSSTLTDLHREQSWISELMTQFTPGTPLEILEDGERWCFVRMDPRLTPWATFCRPYGAGCDDVGISHTHFRLTQRTRPACDGGVNV